ncbi:MAG: hypothetical protein KatS3mg127_0562 [Silanimonas sp.]|nr:MAG: hypothetical protein KatS3mg127_0562 [Silanimonas sp.]
MALTAAGRGFVLPAGVDRRGEGESGLAPPPAAVAALATGLPPPLSGTGLPRLDLHAAFPQAPPLHGARFSEDLGARLQWMAGRGGGEATLRIAPEGLGPVEIRLSLEGDRVDLGFHAAQAETRHALEQALPRLRELLAQQGLSLGQADVGERMPSRGGEAGDRGFAGSAGHAVQDRGSGAGESEGLVVRPPPSTSDGLLDLYA